MVRATRNSSRSPRQGDSPTPTLAGHRADDPIINPLRADLKGLPTLLVQAATGDERLADAQELVERATTHGVDVRLEVYPVDAHVFHIFWSFLPLASKAFRAAGDFVREHRQNTQEPASSRRGDTA